MCQSDDSRFVKQVATWEGFPQTNPARIIARQVAQIDYKNGNHAEYDKLRNKYVPLFKKCPDPEFQRWFNRARGIFQAAYRAEQERLRELEAEKRFKDIDSNDHGPFSGSKRKREEWFEGID